MNSTMLLYFSRYNYTGEEFFVKKKDRGFRHVTSTAKLIIREALPIQCVEAVFVGAYLTADMSEVIAEYAAGNNSPPPDGCAQECAQHCIELGNPGDARRICCPSFAHMEQAAFHRKHGQNASKIWCQVGLSKAEQTHSRCAKILKSTSRPGGCFRVSLSANFPLKRASWCDWIVIFPPSLDQRLTISNPEFSCFALALLSGAVTLAGGPLPPKVDRFPVCFRSSLEGRVYRHIILAVRSGKLWGALGLSRRDTLMYKELK